MYSAADRKLAWKASHNNSGQNGSNSSSNNSTEEEDSQNEKIIQSLTSKYTECEESNDLLTKTLEHLRENIKAGICLICIEDVERTDPIWTCRNCYCILHLVCIQRWAKDSISNVKEKAAEKGFNLPIIFCCPKCRGEYSESEFPDRYKCFCKKVINPKSDPWNAPHSCGEPCGKPLQPECGHVCLLLCHSGPCPPCPKQVNSTCYCGQSSPKTLRCFAKTWSCGKTCSKSLPCTIHKCPNTCHKDECLPCEIPTTLKCKCSSPSTVEVSCSQLTASDDTGKPTFSVSCGNNCKKLLDCEIHKCTRICHEDECGTCERTCPCGKARAPCVGDVEAGKPCEDTCEKVLDCGQHYCIQKCHSGGCGSCLQHVVKKCKCGQYEKEVLCSKEFICTTKCRKIRDCKIHPCNKKCCPGDCPPCRNPCGKTLSCKNHKCESICHSGPCYPCPVTGQAKCRCGETIRQVPCGSEKKCKPPDCYKPCTRPTKCEHSKIQNHRCHFGDCPKCRIPCGKTLSCRHQCPAICHTTKVKGENSKPCPKCVQLVNPNCTLHTDVKVLCHNSDKRCQEICGKPLGCNEHFCSKPCHNDLSTDCGDCNEPCGKPRIPGCVHQCELGCHQGPCQPCTLVATVMCHCGTEQMFVQCCKQSRLSESERSCKNQCPKKLTCSHRCLTLCHSGECPELEKCRRKVKLTCKCRHLKKDVECFLVSETKTLDCSPGICNIPKTPKDTPSGGTKKRTRKKKTSEGELQKDDKNGIENDLTDFNQTAKDAKKPSFFSSNLKAIGIIALSAFITATILQFYGYYFSSPSDIKL